MKKNIPLITFLLCSVIGWAQIPTGYYSTATGSGYVLKTQLNKIIDNQNDGLSPEYISIDQGYNAIDDFFPIVDRDIYYDNDNSVMDVYSELPLGPDPTGYPFQYFQDECGNYSGEGDCFNKEHVVPQSIFSQNSPMRGDAHHLLPTDGRVNGFRSNFPFGYVGSNLVSQSGITNPTRNGSKLGNNINTGLFSGYTGTVFEPIDEFKGDIARINFYFITRYENQVSGWSYPMYNGTSSQVLTNTFLYTMLAWHLNDPVSQKEIDRNNAIFLHQNNRNPFIDHPEYVCQIWSTQCATLSSESFAFENTISIYPNPAVNNEVSISSETELKSIVLYNINGQIIQEIKNPTRVDNSYKVTNLPSGFYLVQLGSDNAVSTKKVIVK